METSALSLALQSAAQRPGAGCQHSDAQEPRSHLQRGLSCRRWRRPCRQGARDLEPGSVGEVAATWPLAPILLLSLSSCWGACDHSPRHAAGLTLPELGLEGPSERSGNSSGECEERGSSCPRHTQNGLRQSGLHSRPHTCLPPLAVPAPVDGLLTHSREVPGVCTSSHSAHLSA